MPQQNVISHSKSSCYSTLILGKEKDGTFRELYAIILPGKYPLPNIGDFLRHLRGAKIFSTLDLQITFWQTKLEEND